MLLSASVKPSARAEVVFSLPKKWTNSDVQSRRQRDLLSRMTRASANREASCTWIERWNAPWSLTASSFPQKRLEDLRESPHHPRLGHLGKRQGQLVEHFYLQT